MGTRGTHALLVVTLTAFAAQAEAHEKWFKDPAPYPLRWDLFFRLLPLALVAGVLVLTFLLWLAWRARGYRSLIPGPEAFGATSEHRAALYGLIPFMLGIHLAVPLLVNGVQGHLFSPDNTLASPWNYLLGLAQAGIALAIFYGALTRLAAAALALLWLISLPVIGVEPTLDNAFYLGFAAFFFLAGRGPISVDRLLFPALEPSPAQMERAVTALRVGLGTSLIVVAFTEKFANIQLALAFLREYPLNFTAAFGIPMSDEAFALSAGAVELLAGLLILFGIFHREIVLVAWIPINMTLTVFDWKELIGHLPIYGVMALLVVWAASPENRRLWMRGLREGPLGLPEATSDQETISSRRAQQAHS